MKAFVRDFGWVGASIYFSESRETAVEYFRNKEIQAHEAEIAQHDVKKNGQRIVDRVKEDIERVKSIYYEELISEYECLEGNTFTTDGE